MSLSTSQTENFVDRLQNHAAAAIKELNALQEIIAFASANGMLEQDGLVLDGTAYADVDPAAVVAAITAVGGVVTYLQGQGVYTAVAAILPAPAL